MNELKTYNRILILGCPGSGKTHYAKKLESLLGYSLYSLDDLYWKANWQRPLDKEFIQLLEPIVEMEQWIIEGNYSRFLDIRLKHAEVVVLLDKPTLTCLFRVVGRAFKRKFLSQADLPVNVRKETNGGNFRFDPHFFRLILRFRKETKPIMLEKIRQTKHVKIIFR